MESERTIVIPHILNQQILADVDRKLPEEACGLLAGLAGCVVKIFEITNAAHSPVRFFMAPEELVGALQAIDHNGWELVGIYHSHPNGPAFPSPTDLAEFAYPGAAYLIWFRESGVWKCLGYDILADEPGSGWKVQYHHFIPVRIQVSE